MHADPVVGREEELAILAAFVEGDEPAALVLCGEAGIGKTTLWRRGVEEAERRDALALTARPVAAEAKLAFAGLGDLLAPAVDDVLSELPPPQGRALAAALLLEEEAESPPDGRAVALATLAALRALAARSPLLVAVDDTQWLDHPTVLALAFAGRRLADDPVSFLLARRGRPDDAPTPLEEALADRLAHVAVGPVGLAELHRILQARLGAVLPRPVLRRLYEHAGGNPFFALELARAAGPEVAGLAPADALPATLEALVRDRVAALPEDSRRVLAAAAALSQPSLGVVAAALDADPRPALAAARTAAVAEPAGDRVEFAHPLLAAAAYLSVDDAERRDLHRRLAAVVEDVEERGRHLALAAEGPDEEVAAALDAAAARALSRGAPDAAARLADRAADLTPAGLEGEMRRRRSDAALLHFESGDARRARGLLEDLAAGLPPGAERARVLVRLARVRSYGDDLRAAARLFGEALAEAGHDAEARATAHEGLAACLFRLRERLGDGRDHARAAVDLARAHGDESLAAEALGSRLAHEALAGHEDARATLAEALRSPGTGRVDRVVGDPELMAAFVWMWWDDLARARSAAERLLARTRELGDESSLPYVLFLLAQLECREGLLDSAVERAQRARELSVQAGQLWLEAYALALVALAEGYRGRGEECRPAAERALELAGRTSAVPAELFARTGLGHLELSLGEPVAALRAVQPLVDWAAGEAVEEPGAMPFFPDALEALVEAGRVDDAEELLGAYAGRARRLGRGSALGAVARIEGLVAAARGEHEAAVKWLERASALLGEVPLPLERARTLLALGAAYRRAKRKRDSRRTLTDALAAFERHGARAWAARASAELGRIGGRAPARGELTPSERRVAALVAEGRTNREVAAALFVSDRTVEGHLSRIYAKLGLRSRAELARRFRDGEEPG